MVFVADWCEAAKTWRQILTGTGSGNVNRALSMMVLARLVSDVVGGVIRVILIADFYGDPCRSLDRFSYPYDHPFDRIHESRVDYYHAHWICYKVEGVRVSIGSKSSRK